MLKDKIEIERTDEVYSSICSTDKLVIPREASDLRDSNLIASGVVLHTARIESLTGSVEVIPEGKSARPAQPGMVLSVGDSLRTGTGALAELRFNDNSLARIGEQETFKFEPSEPDDNEWNILRFILPRNDDEEPSSVVGIQG